ISSNDFLVFIVNLDISLLFNIKFSILLLKSLVIFSIISCIIVFIRIASFIMIFVFDTSIITYGAILFCVFSYNYFTLTKCPQNQLREIFSFCTFYQK